MDSFDIFFYFGFCGGGIAFVIFGIVMWIRQYKRDKLRQATEPKVDEHKTEFETESFQAKVIDLYCRAEMIGIKTPKSVEIFTVVFESADKNEIKIDVPQEMYDGLELGQSGEVTIVEGELYSFIVD